MNLSDREGHFIYQTFCLNISENIAGISQDTFTNELESLHGL